MAGCKICSICDESFHFQSGKFSKHIEEIHSLSLEEYSRIYEWNNNPPKCGCGYCNETTPFFRGKFKENFIYSSHRNPDWKKTQHIKKYGKPTCKSCGKEHENFSRGVPRKHCSKCIEEGQINQNNPEPFRRGWENSVKVMLEKYGVNNPMKLDKNKKTNSVRMKKHNPMFDPKIAKKSGKTQKDRIKSGEIIPYAGTKRTEAIKKSKNTKKNRYGDENFNNSKKALSTYLEKTGLTHVSKNLKFRNDASKRMIEYNSNWKKNHSIKKFKETSLYYQSSFELDFLNLCERLNILDRISNGNSYKYLNKNSRKRLLTDFCLDNKFEIEIKSSYIMKKQGGISEIFNKKESVEFKGKKYIFILDKDYKEFLSLV